MDRTEAKSQSAYLGRAGGQTWVQAEFGEQEAGASHMGELCSLSMEASKWEGFSQGAKVVKTDGLGGGGGAGGQSCGRRGALGQVPLTLAGGGGKTTAPEEQEVRD